MMIFKRKGKCDADSINLIKRIGGKSFSTVSAVDENGEKVLGHGGAVNIVGDEAVIVSNGTETFRCTLQSLRAGELMSGNGVRLSGVDKEGNRHSVIAIYNKI